MAESLMEDDDGYLYDEDKMGMRITSGTVKIKKDDNNLVGISIGGGAPNCPCLYVVQVFDNTPAAKDGILEAGDEIVTVNGKCVKSSTKVEVAKLIQSVKGEVTICYNKLHADQKQGKTLDIILKKLKHKMVDNMSSATADALGLSRAILCNDSLVKKLQELDRNEYIFKGLISHMNFTIKGYVELVSSYKDFGEVFAEIGAHEPQTEASKAFTKFGEIHRTFEKEGAKLIKQLKPVMGDLNTYLNKAIPDSRLTIKKYADAKFEYLSYCLKVKEMDDEEYTYQALQEPLYRVETGNYEYRLILRCRQEARKRFACLRSDVLVKLELLDQKHVHNIASQITSFISSLAKFNGACHQHLSENLLFPIELDLSKSSLIQNLTNQQNDYEAISVANFNEFRHEKSDMSKVYHDYPEDNHDNDDHHHHHRHHHNRIDLAEEAELLLGNVYNAIDDNEEEEGPNLSKSDITTSKTPDSKQDTTTELQNLIDIFNNLDNNSLETETVTEPKTEAQSSQLINYDFDPSVDQSATSNGGDTSTKTESADQLLLF